MGLFRKVYPQLSKAITAFVISLIPGAVLSATYGSGSWQLTLIGLFSYATVIMGLYLGFIYPRNQEDVRKLMAFFCILTAVMLIGTPIEYLGFAKEWPAIGASALGFDWIRSKPGYIVHMVSGFYRSPDVMGWHAVLSAMLAGTMALYCKGGRRYFWIILAAWGIAATMLCGRRKMLLMLPVYLLVVSWIYWRLRLNVKRLLVMMAILTLIGYQMYKRIGPSSELEKYYFNEEEGEIAHRVEAHGINEVLSTYEQSGFWGEGVGTATQGTQHLEVTRPRTWQEGGLSRLLVELGVPGLVCFLIFGLTFIATLWRMIRSQFDVSAAGFPLLVGLIAIVAANGASFLISHQIFGDPFILCFFSFMIGVTLAGERMGVVVKCPVRRPVRPSRYGAPQFDRRSPTQEGDFGMTPVTAAGGPGVSVPENLRSS
jgi:membrane protein implicated in regulation of membrane protease activity